MHPAIESIRSAIQGTPFEGDLYLVGGAVRDELLGKPLGNDFDLVTRQSAPELAEWLWSVGASQIRPTVYPRFGTAMIRVDGADVELITARRESYSAESRKPSVESATYLEDAQRRDFTVNTLLKDIASGQVLDPLGMGLSDLAQRWLRTPLDPAQTFYDDPLRMLRAVRFRWQLDFQPVPGLYQAIRTTRERLRIISFERIRDELMKMLVCKTASRALADLQSLGLFEVIAPEFDRMVGVEQGNFHHLDVWDHTLLVIDNLWSAAAAEPSLELVLGALLHDVGKPDTRTKDNEGRTRFFGHEEVGEKLARSILSRWKFSERDIERVARLVRHHMRLGSSPTFTKSAARRVLRDLDDQVDDLLELVDADTRGLKPGVKQLDLAPIRAQLAVVSEETPRESLQSPLSGEEIMTALALAPGPEVGRLKALLTEKVLEGDLAPGDKEAALQLLKASS